MLLKPFLKVHTRKLPRALIVLDRGGLRMLIQGHPERILVEYRTAQIRGAEFYIGAVKNRLPLDRVIEVSARNDSRSGIASDRPHELFQETFARDPSSIDHWREMQYGLCIRDHSTDLDREVLEFLHHHIIRFNAVFFSVPPRRFHEIPVTGR